MELSFLPLDEKIANPDRNLNDFETRNRLRYILFFQKANHIFEEVCLTKSSFITNSEALEFTSIHQQNPFQRKDRAISRIFRRSTKNIEILVGLIIKGNPVINFAELLDLWI